MARIRAKYLVLSGHLDERARRLWAAAEAKSLGYGGATLVQIAIGRACSTIRRGCAQIDSDNSLAIQRIRKPGGGRRPVACHDPSFPAKLENPIEPVTRGDPESPPRRTCKSTRKRAEVEHRLFARVGQNRRGEPLTSYETIVKLVSSTTTNTGLEVHCRLDMDKDPPQTKSRQERNENPAHRNSGIPWRMEP
ncbi:MAG: hypothetical protein LBE84_06370 [Planctomycetota bacterium]|nr:hypothetical protein [Planctomycetota bacterium]